ncbi:MAG: YheC/YheD family protein [Syntrophomonadaceae bacterium]|jgi:glutathione synthase/RimK-type ligase-like ATP-grasp enzyme|nr:YheC/YheD family protein [Syntrophomonadaceae bacterium]
MSKEIYIARKIMEQNNIPPLDMTEVRVGSIVVRSRVRTRENSEGFSISPDLARALNLKSSKKLRLRYDEEEHRLHLGPVIGILATALPNRANLDDMEPTSLQAELSYLSRIGKGMRAMVYIFLPSGINWNSRTVKGYNYRLLSGDKGVWESSLYPLPDVVYNRISSRKSEIRESVQSTLQRLSELEYCQVFNPSYLNKWQVYQTLCQNWGLIPHLPETRRLNEENLSYMIERYGVLYLKPSNGSLGIGIIKVRKQVDSTLKFTVYSKGRINGSSNSANQLLKKTSGYRKGKPYIVQQGLDLSRYHGSVFDLRIIFQKNGQGEWQIGKKFARLAPGKSSISNLSRGGRVITSRVLMKTLYKKKALIEEKNAGIKELCLKVATTLDTASAGSFGELGLDIGIDKKGWLWLIEVNSKPRKTTSTDTSQIIMRNSFKRPLEYGAYLAGFPIGYGKRRSIKAISTEMEIGGV